MESFLPISMVLGGSMTLELTLADSQQECCDTTKPFGHNWNVSQLACHYDVIAIDAQFLTSLSQHLFGGNALQMQFKNYNTSFYSLLAATVQLTHSRAASRLNSVFTTFAKAVADGKKTQNDLYLPPTQALRALLTVGERRFPASEDLQGLSFFFMSASNRR